MLFYTNLQNTDTAHYAHIIYLNYKCDKHRPLYYGLCTIITKHTNFILTPTADSGFILI